MFVKLLCILQNPLQEALLDTEPLLLHSSWLTFDLGNKGASSCQCLQRVQQWVLGDDLTHHTQGLTQAFMGQWPAGIKEVCWAQ